MGRSRPYDQLLAVCLLSCRAPARPQLLLPPLHLVLTRRLGMVRRTGGAWGVGAAMGLAAALQERKALKASQQQAMLTAQAGAAGGAPPMHLRPTKSKNEKDECVIAPTPPLPPAALHLSLCQAACFQACLVGTAPPISPPFTPARRLLTAAISSAPSSPRLPLRHALAPGAAKEPRAHCPCLPCAVGMPREPIRQPPLTFCGRPSREVLMSCGSGGAPISPGKMSTPGGTGGAKKRKSEGGCEDCPLSCFVGVWDKYGEGIPGRLALLQDLPLR